MFGKLLSLVSIGEALVGISMAKKIATQFVVVLGLTIIASIVAGGIVIFALYEFHLILVHQGINFDIAALATLLVGLLIFFIFVSLIIYKLKLMRAISVSFPRAESAGSSLWDVAHSFYQGFTEKGSD